MQIAVRFLGPTIRENADSFEPFTPGGRWTKRRISGSCCNATWSWTATSVRVPDGQDEYALIAVHHPGTVIATTLASTDDGRKNMELSETQKNLVANHADAAVEVAKAKLALSEARAALAKEFPEGLEIARVVSSW